MWTREKKKGKTNHIWNTKKRGRNNFGMAQSPNIIWVTSTNIYYINRVFIQQTLEVIGQITKSNTDLNPWEMLKIKPVILELYKQIMQYLFNKKLMKRGILEW